MFFLYTIPHVNHFITSILTLQLVSKFLVNRTVWMARNKRKKHDKSAMNKHTYTISFRIVIPFWSFKHISFKFMNFSFMMCAFLARILILILICSLNKTIYNVMYHIYVYYMFQIHSLNFTLFRSWSYTHHILHPCIHIHINIYSIYHSDLNQTTWFSLKTKNTSRKCIFVLL